MSWANTSTAAVRRSQEPAPGDGRPAAARQQRLRGAGAGAAPLAAAVDPRARTGAVAITSTSTAASTSARAAARQAVERGRTPQNRHHKTFPQRIKIGASQVGACAGVHPYADVDELWHGLIYQGADG